MQSGRGAVDDEGSSRPGLTWGGDDRPLRDRLWGNPLAGALAHGGDEQQTVRLAAAESNQRQFERLPADMRESDLLQQQHRLREKERLLQQASASIFSDSRLSADRHGSYNREQQLARLAAMQLEQQQSRRREDAVRRELELRSQLFAARSATSYVEDIADRRGDADYRRGRLSGADSSLPVSLPGESNDARTLSGSRGVGDSQQFRLADRAAEDEEIRRGEARVASLRHLMLEEEQNLLFLQERNRRRLLRAGFESQPSSRFLLPDRLRASDASRQDLALAARSSASLDAQLGLSRLLTDGRVSHAGIGGREGGLARSASHKMGRHDALPRTARLDKTKSQTQGFDEHEISVAVTGRNQGTPRSAASKIAASLPHDAAKPPSKGMPLALPTDKGLVSTYQSLIRESLEFFEAQTEDIAWSMQGRKNKIVHKQIGVRCRFCAHRPAREKGRGSVYFPGKLTGVYQAAQNMTFTHLLESCKDIPADIRETLGEARKNQRIHDKRGGGKKYWVESGKNMGLHERDGQSGLFLMSEKQGM